MLPGNASLARLIKDHGDQWITEHTGPSTAWVAVRRDDFRIVGARDVGGLGYHIERVEKAFCTMIRAGPKAPAPG